MLSMAYLWKICAKNSVEQIAGLVLEKGLALTETLRHGEMQNKNAA